MSGASVPKRFSVGSVFRTPKTATQNQKVQALQRSSSLQVLGLLREKFGALTKIVDDTIEATKSKPLATSRNPSRKLESLPKMSMLSSTKTVTKGTNQSAYLA